MSGLPQKMRLFVAAPEDLRVEREQVIRAADRINRHTEKESGAPVFEILDWSDHLALNLGGAAIEAHEHLPVEATDVFIGLGWLRFSAPSNGPTAEREYRCSSADDFEVAWRSWERNHAAPRLWYRCQRLPKRLREINGERLAEIDRFFARCEETSDYREIFDAAEIGESVEKELLAVLERAPDAGVPTSSEPAPPPSQPTAHEDPSAAPAESPPSPGDGLGEFERKMVPGRAYEVTFLSLEITAWDELVERHDAEEVAKLLGAFQRLVVETAASYGGELFRWEGGQGLLIFWHRRNSDQAIMTGLKVIHALPVFNLDPMQNPLASKVELAAAANNAVIVFEMPRTAITSPDIDFTLALRARSAPGELLVSRRLLDRTDERLRPRFQAKARFDGEPVFSCRLPSSEQRAVRTNFQEIRREVETATARIREVLGRGAGLGAEGLGVLRAAIDETYAQLDKACALLGRLGGSWPKDLYAELADNVAGLVKHESALWQLLRTSHLEHQGSMSGTQLEAIVRAASSRRSRPAVTLARAEQGLRARGTGEPELPKVPPTAPPSGEPIREPELDPSSDSDLLKKADALIKADPLDLETAMTDLLLNKKNELVSYLLLPEGDTRRALLVDKLWQAADLLLIDDLYSIRGHQRASDNKVSEVLATGPVADGRFRALAEALKNTAKPDSASLQRMFRKAGAEHNDEGEQIIWRCFVLAHAEQDLRSHAAFQLNQLSIWQTISLPNIPLASIYAIGERVGKAETEDVKKIFFDCVRSRIADAVDAFKTRDELSYITKLILLLLDFPFLVETGYFERFDDILETFLERAQQAGVKVDFFENLRQRLDTAHQDPENQKMSKPPAGIKQLPLTIQRRLAGEPQYVFWFVTHPDPRVANETLRHISLSNVERVLKLPEVNQAVFMALLKKPEYFTRSAPLLAALNNPKCETQFANRHLGTLSRTRGGTKALEQIARNSSANPAVRGTAQRLMRTARR